MSSRILPQGVQYGIVCSCLLIAVVTQARWGHRFAVRDIAPDLVQVVLGASIGLIGGMRRGLGFGLLAGVFSAALFPLNAGTRIVSCALGGIAAASLRKVLSSGSPLMAPACGLVCSGAIEISALLMAPTHHLHAWLEHSAGDVVYNTLLTIPVYYLLRCLHIGRTREPSVFGT
jgi:hypothetical protein